MVNDCVRIGLMHGVSTMKQLSSLAYRTLACYDILSYYKLCAISHAAGILANRKKSIKRGLQPRQPYARRPLLVSCYGFKVKGCGTLKIPIGGRQYYDIPLDSYLRNVLFNTSFRVRSFTLTPDSVSICYSKEVEKIECIDVVGLDRNLRNVTVGNKDNIS